MSAFGSNVERLWYSKPRWLLLLAPLTALFIFLAFLRRQRYQLFPSPSLPVPVVVIGNITVGGTGKTPFIASMAERLAAAGFKPGIISRGYGAKLDKSVLVDQDSSASDVGDEPLLLFRLSGCPVAVGPNRVESAQRLVGELACDIILSDDGLQHYRLPRDIEIALIDGSRKLGNGWRLPVGPLRESSKRLQEIDYVLVNGARFSAPWLPEDKTWGVSLKPRVWRNVKTGESCRLDRLPLSKAQALAGIGNPQRFFDTLLTLGFDGLVKTFPDHHAFTVDDIDQFCEKSCEVVLMTEKDAVKCQAFAKDHWWALVVEMELESEFLDAFMKKITLDKT